MEVKEIISLEQQATELIQNIDLIKQEISKKVATREQFERETTKIVENLSEVVKEMKNLKMIFELLGESQMVKLFNKMDETNNQVADTIPKFDAKIGMSVDKFDNIYQKILRSNSTVETALEVNNEQVASLMNKIQQSNHTVSKHFEQITAVFQNQNIEVASINPRITEHEKTVAKCFDNVSMSIFNELQKLDTKLTQQEEETTVKLKRISSQITENEKQQQNISNKLDSILEWLDSNGQILIANSRTSLFGKKQ